MKRLGLALCAISLAVVTLFAAGAILNDDGGAESAGPVPSSYSTRAGTPGERAALDSDITVEALAGAPNVDYVLDLNDGEPLELPDSIVRAVANPIKGRRYPRWLPRYAATRDGSQLAFVGTGDGGSAQIFIADLDGENVRQVTHDPAGARFPAWSPDATKIAYQGSEGLSVLDVASRKSTALRGARRIQPWSGAQFTPDGSALVYSGPVRYGFSELRTVPIDGGKSTVFIGRDQGFEVANGSLSPDGSLVTMMGNEVGGPGAVRFVANADGTDGRMIAGRSSNPAGTWSPDGRRIVCAGTDDKSNNSVIVVDVATGRISPVAEGNGAIWLDNDTLLVERS